MTSSIRRLLLPRTILSPATNTIRGLSTSTRNSSKSTTTTTSFPIKSLPRPHPHPQRFHQTPILAPTTTPTTRKMSTQGYGDYSLDPVSSNPQDQGPRPHSETEHPGPEPVAEGRGKGGVKGKPVPKDTRGTGGEATNNEKENVGEWERMNKNVNERVQDRKKGSGAVQVGDVEAKRKGYADDGEGFEGFGGGRRPKIGE
ncbi:hypothetical protein DFH27DRAFT_609300 [Peziza echinospora]|nr:hypothetical protein DFH27DRAFT_609300 [Peziza echinospora]